MISVSLLLPDILRRGLDVVCEESHLSTDIVHEREQSICPFHSMHEVVRKCPLLEERTGSESGLWSQITAAIHLSLPLSLSSCSKPAVSIHSLCFALYIHACVCLVISISVLQQQNAAFKASTDFCVLEQITSMHTDSVNPLWIHTSYEIGRDFKGKPCDGTETYADGDGAVQGTLMRELNFLPWT